MRGQSPLRGAHEHDPYAARAQLVHGGGTRPKSVSSRNFARLASVSTVGGSGSPS